MTHTLSQSKSKEESGYWRPVGRAEVTRNVPTRLPVFRGMLRAAFECQSKDLDTVRTDLADWLDRARDPMPYVKELLRYCIRRRSEGGLHVAIDILGLTNELAMQYAHQFQGKDAQRWSRDWRTAKEDPSDDVWRILLVAACRASKEMNEKLHLLGSCYRAGNRGIREAVVEGLGVIATPKAKQYLGLIAEDADDPFIRKLAEQTREEIA